MTTKTKTKGKTQIKLQSKNVELFFLPHENLDMLEKHVRNRLNEDNTSQIKKLKRSYREKKGFDSREPVIIDSCFVIQDGHNRYQAALEEGIGVWYTVDDDFDLLRDNLQKGLAKKWSTVDFIRGYAHELGGAYKAIMNIHEEYGNRIGIKVIIASAVGITNEASGSVFERIQSGAFTFPKRITYDTMVKDMKEVLLLNSLVSPLCRKTGVNNQFSLAYFWIRSQPHFDKNRFFKKLSIMEQDVKPQIGGQRPNRTKLVALYNYNLKKNRIPTP
jgi:hypothetical protein